MLFATDSSTASIVAAMAGVAGLLISTVGSVVIAFIAFKTAQLGRQVEVIHKATNSLAAAMGEAKLAQGTAEGTAVGLAQQRNLLRKRPHRLRQIVRTPIVNDQDLVRPSGLGE